MPAYLVCIRKVRSRPGVNEPASVYPSQKRRRRVVHPEYPERVDASLFVKDISYIIEIGKWEVSIERRESFLFSCSFDISHHYLHIL